MMARETDWKWTVGDVWTHQFRCGVKGRMGKRTCEGRVRVPDPALRSEVEDRLALPQRIERVAQELRIGSELLRGRHARKGRIEDEEPRVVEGDRCAGMVVQRPRRGVQPVAVPTPPAVQLSEQLADDLDEFVPVERTESGDAIQACLSARDDREVLDVNAEEDVDVRASEARCAQDADVLFNHLQFLAC